MSHLDQPFLGAKYCQVLMQSPQETEGFTVYNIFMTPKISPYITPEACDECSWNTGHSFKCSKYNKFQTSIKDPDIKNLQKKQNERTCNSCFLIVKASNFSSNSNICIDCGGE